MIDDLDFELECACNHCDYAENILVHESDYIAWHNGVLIQDAFPYLTDGQRELMISNTCDTCFDKFWPDNELQKTKILFLHNSSEHSEHVLEVLREREVEVIEYSTKTHGRWDEKSLLDYDLGISFLYQFKVGAEQLQKKWINFHPAPLPEFGGRNVAYHAIMSEAENFGGTIHYMSEKIDHGDIIECRRFPIQEEDTAGTLVEKSYAILSDLFCDYIDTIVSGHEISAKQQSTTNYFKYKDIHEYIEITKEQQKRIRALTVHNKFNAKIRIGTDTYKIVKDV